MRTSDPRAQWRILGSRSTSNKGGHNISLATFKEHFERLNLVDHGADPYDLDPEGLTGNEVLDQPITENEIRIQGNKIAKQ